jgi:hypothetical protein
MRLHLGTGNAEKGRTDHCAFAGRHPITLVEGIVSRHFGPSAMRVHSTSLSVYDVSMKGVFHIGLRILRSIKRVKIGLVVCEETRKFRS